MLCAWSSQYPHRPIPPDQSRSVYRVQRGSRRASTCFLSELSIEIWTVSPKGHSLSGRKRELHLEGGLWWRLRRHSPPRHGTDRDSKPVLLLPGFCYQNAHFSADKKSIEAAVRRPRKGSAAVCSRCHLAAPGYDQLAERRFEFIPPVGISRASFCTLCGASTVAAVGGTKPQGQNHNEKIVRLSHLTGSSNLHSITHFAGCQNRNPPTISSDKSKLYKST